MTTQLSTLSNTEIARYAEQLGERYGVNEPTPDLSAMVDALGGRIEYADVPESSVVDGPNDFVIFLPRHTSRRRNRFTIAHELGHYFLHYRLPKLVGRKEFGRGERNGAETQANVFAAALLMPAADFRRAWDESGGDANRVAGEFEVSPVAADVRASVLRLR